MGVRSTVLTRVPGDVRKQLEQRLVEKGFSGYDELTSWLHGLGYTISRAAVIRYGRQFEQHLSAVTVASEQARALVDAASKEGTTINEALIRLVQERVFNLLIETERPFKQIELSRLARTVGDLSRTAIAHSRWVTESRERLEHQRQSATGKLDSIEGEGGLSPAAVQLMRDILMSIDPFAPSADTPDSDT